MRTEDGYIIQKCLNGNASAFGFLVDKYKKSVYALAYSEIRNFHDAQDITQEVFIKAYRNLNTLRSWDNFMGWLCRITTNLCKNWFRSQSRRPDREFVADQEINTLDQPFINSHHENDMYDSVQEALASLPEMYSQVLTLQYFGGMTIKEMSRFIGVSPATIKRRLGAARAQLKEEILAMMGTAYEQQQLPANLTFKIVETVKRIKIKPISKATSLPLGMSLAAGIAIAILSLSPHMNISSQMVLPKAAPLSAEMEVLKTGEIPVEIVKTSETLIISSMKGDRDAREPLLQNQQAFQMAPGVEGGKWAKKTEMPTARYGLSTATVDGKIYAIGGNGGAWAVEEYDPSKDTWTRKANMPSQRSGFATCVVDGKIYAIGGSERFIINGPLRTVEEYDPATDTWAKKADMPTPRELLSTCVVDGKIYAIGGGTFLNNFLVAVEEYDPAKDTWTKKADMPTPRQSLSTSVVDGKIYAIGGLINGLGQTAAVEEYDPKTDTWINKSDMLIARWSVCAGVVDEKIYVIGGKRNGMHVSTVGEYDPATDSWQQMADMPTARYIFSISVVDEKIYAIGGLITLNGNQHTALTAVEEYDPKIGQPSGGLETPRTVTPRAKLPTKWGAIKSY